MVDRLGKEADRPVAEQEIRPVRVVRLEPPGGIPVALPLAGLRRVEAATMVVRRIVGVRGGRVDGNDGAVVRGTAVEVVPGTGPVVVMLVRFHFSDQNRVRQA